jgi:parallel beta-helix repeat protein
LVVVKVTGAVADVTVADLDCLGCRVLESAPAANRYAEVNDENSPSQISVCNCTATGTKIESRAAAIFLSYCRDSAVWANRIYSHLHGIAWWGGDAAVDGKSITSPRKCRNLRIFGNLVADVHAGGIWGSMGQSIAISGNTVNSCGDVGIDLEGCVSCSVTGNTVRDSANGCLTTFFANTGIVFSANSCIVTRTAYPLFRIYNATLSPAENIDVTVNGNSFTCVSREVGVVNEAGPYRVLDFSGNILRNVRIAWQRVNNFHAVHIRANTLTFDAEPEHAFNAIDCCGGFGFDHAPGQVTISGNRIIAYRARTDSVGINVVTNDFNASSIVRIEGNTIQGFTTDIATTEAGTNPFIAGVYFLIGNVMSAGTYVRQESGVKRSTVNYAGNYAADGTPLTNSAGIVR